MFPLSANSSANSMGPEDKALLDGTLVNTHLDTFIILDIPVVQKRISF
jgi:hypothetical protein